MYIYFLTQHKNVLIGLQTKFSWNMLHVLSVFVHNYNVEHDISTIPKRGNVSTTTHAVHLVLGRKKKTLTKNIPVLKIHSTKNVIFL